MRHYHGDAPLRAACARQPAYLSQLLDSAGDLAAEIHAEAVSVEHLLGASLRDEESAAHQAVLFAFADPATVLQEVLALCPGVLVVGSKHTRPFSHGAARALESAQSLALAASAALVTEETLARACLAELPLHIGGLSAPSEPSTAHLPRRDSRLRLTEGSKQALSRAARAAASAGEPTLSPARILLALLFQDSGLAASLAVDPDRLRRELSGVLLDTSLAEPRSLPAEASLTTFICALPPGAGSLALLGAYHAGTTPELAELLLRHKVNPGLIARACGKFADPEVA